MEQKLIQELKQASERYMQALEFVKNRDHTVLERDIALLNTVLREFHQVATPEAVFSLCVAASRGCELRQSLANSQREICDLKDILASSSPLHTDPSQQQEAP